ncbi:MAG: hypothetical protein H0V82_04770, partial [Candidatus Protochlamydia sp.]|nr:hypothetical protein [Candidatus Protochlamydia sp.]
DARVAQKRTEAIACFVQAAVSFASMKATMGNSVKARQTCTKERDTHVKELKDTKANHEKDIPTLSSQNQSLTQIKEAKQLRNKKLEEELNPPKKSDVALTQDGLEKAKPLPLTPKEVEAKKREIDSNNRDIDDCNSKIDANNQKIEGDTKLANKVQERIDEMESSAYLEKQTAAKTIELNQITSMQQQTLSSVVSGSSKFIESSYEQEAGYIDAFIQELDGYARAMQRFTDSASKASDKSASLADAINNLMMKITDSSFHATNISNALG